MFSEKVRKLNNQNGDSSLKRPFYSHILTSSQKITKEADHANYSEYLLWKTNNQSLFIGEIQMDKLGLFEVLVWDFGSSIIKEEYVCLHPKA